MFTKMRRFGRFSMDVTAGVLSLVLIVAMGFRAVSKADAAYSPTPVVALTNLSSPATAAGPGSLMTNHWTLTSSKSGVFVVYIQAAAQVLDNSDPMKKHLTLAVLQDMQTTLGYSEQREPPLGNQSIDAVVSVKVNPGATFDLLARLTGPQMSVARFRLIVVEY